jgi:SAM-dependent methyltransferase
MKIDWYPSTDVKYENELESLDKELLAFYSKPSSRCQYNVILEEKGSKDIPDGAEKAFLEWISKKKYKHILEIGCGMGWMFNRISQIKTEVQYTGIELSESQIYENMKRFPKASWVVGSAYQVPLQPFSFECVFSLYVLEHLVYPKRGLDNMYQLLKPGGTLLLVFPDFVAKGNLPSQKLGYGYERTAMEKLKKGKILDGILSLIDSRIILPSALRSLRNKTGGFYINANPICLIGAIQNLWSDIDAVYISHKLEVEQWALQKGMKVTYPFGKKGFFAAHAFMVLEKLN